MVHIFIINSNTGKVGFGESLRQELSQIPGLTYFVFSTRKPGGEADLAVIATVIKLKASRYSIAIDGVSVSYFD